MISYIKYLAFNVPFWGAFLAVGALIHHDWVSLAASLWLIYASHVNADHIIGQLKDLKQLLGIRD